MSAAPALPEPLLLDYAAGTAGPAIGLLMATHLCLSKEGRGLYAFMESVGGALLDDIEEELLERISAANTLELADLGEAGPNIIPWPQSPGHAQPQPRQGTPSTFNSDDMPFPLRIAEGATGGDRRWRKLGIGVAVTRLTVSANRERVHLLWAKGGTSIAEHRHVGREVVLVLQGAFWDQGVRYGSGDVAVSEDGTVHRPSIDRDEDCVCLAVTEAPVRFTGLAGLALNRFCRF